MARKRKSNDDVPSPSKGKSAKSGNGDDKFPLLSLPTEILFQIYLHLDYATRRALRGSGKLAEIEKLTKYRCKCLEVIECSDHVHILFNGTEISIPHSEVKEEFELMRANTTFNTVKISLDSRRLLDEMCLFKGDQIRACSRILNDVDVEFLLTNSNEVTLQASAIKKNGFMRIYEKMRDGQFDGKRLKIYTKDTPRLWNLMEKFGTFNRETLRFTATNTNQVVRRDPINNYLITEGNLKVIFFGVKENSTRTVVQLDTR